MGDKVGESGRWRARPKVAAAVGVGVVVAPIACSVLAAEGFRHLVALPSSTTDRIGWWLALVVVSTAVFVVCERLARRAAPLTVLLKMGMAFPGRAPKRLSVARRSWTTRDLDRRVHEAQALGVSDEPTKAAEHIVALAATLSAHDRMTRGHAERVRAVTDLIAEELRLSEDDRDKLRWSALLHDIGKLAVHADVLNKNGQLTDAEWEIMRRHPLEGAKLTAPLAGWLGPWANTVAEHHERFDGAGYPYGLSRQEISLGGRIVAVADTFDTMTSLRSYKKPMAPEVARRELAKCAGTQFDPVIVRAFLGVSVRRLRAIAPLTWAGALPSGNVGTAVGRAAMAGGRFGLAGFTMAAGVVGLGLASHSAGPSQTTPLAASVHGSPGAAPAGSGSTDPGASAGASPASGASPVSTHAGHRNGTSDSGALPALPGVGDNSPDETTTTDGTSGADPGSGGGDDSSVTTIASGDSGPSATTTTVAGTSPVSTTTTTTKGSSPTTTTTTTAPPPLLPPTGLSASASCPGLIIDPQIALTWTASSSTAATGYQILRDTNGGAYSVLTTVSGRTTTTYTDKSVGTGTTYGYELKATDATTSSVASASASASTASLCLSL